jgi:hypothetical protein
MFHPVTEGGVGYAPRGQIEYAMRGHQTNVHLRLHQVYVRACTRQMNVHQGLHPGLHLHAASGTI